MFCLINAQKRLEVTIVRTFTFAKFFESQKIISSFERFVIRKQSLIVAFSCFLSSEKTMKYPFIVLDSCSDLFREIELIGTDLKFEVYSRLGKGAKFWQFF